MRLLQACQFSDKRMNETFHTLTVRFAAYILHTGKLSGTDKPHQNQASFSLFGYLVRRIKELNVRLLQLCCCLKDSRY